MSVYVDPLMDQGWILQGRRKMNCHLFADTEEELHELAGKIKLRLAWFHSGLVSGGRGEDDFKPPHYDMTLSKRREAIRAGAIQVSRREAVNIWRRLKGAP